MPPKPNAKATAVTADSEATPTQRRDRLDAFRRRLTPHVVDTVLLEFYLRSNNWEVDAAHAEYLQDRTNHLELLRGQGNRDADDSEAQGLFNASIVPWNENPEQERRDAAYAFNERVRSATSNTQALSRTESSLWLNINHWDVGLALRNMTSVAGNPDGIRRTLGRRYDRMREELVPATKQSKKHGQDKTAEKEAEDKLQEQRDERLAEFINITGRPDWYSLLLFLQNRGYNLVQAVEDWYNTGVPPFDFVAKSVKPGTRVGLDGKALPKPDPEDCKPRQSLPKKKKVTVRSSDDDGSSPSPPPPSPAGSDSDPEDNFDDDRDKFLPGSSSGSSSSASPEPSSPSSKERERVQGYIIDDYVDAAKACAPNPRRYLLEYIAKGKYRSNLFEKRGDHWWAERGQVDPGADSGKVPFDWDVQKHINSLNAWWRQNRSRVADEKKRAASQKWSQEENDFLYALSQELLDELKQENPGKSEDDLLPLVIPTKTKDDWARRFNEKFVGQLLPGSSEPRRPRESAAMMTQRGRCKEIIEKFKVPEDKMYAAGRKKAEERRAEKDRAKGKGKAVDGNEDTDMSDVQSVSDASAGKGKGVAPPSPQSPTPPAASPSTMSVSRESSPIDWDSVNSAGHSVINDANVRVAAALVNAGMTPQDNDWAAALRDGLIQEIAQMTEDGGIVSVIRTAALRAIEEQYQGMVNSNQPIAHPRGNKRAASEDETNDDGAPGPSIGPKRRRMSGGDDAEGS
ncbi:hypothetical protein H2204_004471 [Knufia peltigerae]|uniref:Uncharacterized protein n=1 Tax=Knufia peltigerae TaxID=1002370 RepID=A0AA38Y7F1_9EURO|nr:hypothetical protein H2204_004471 [Knufia peltigerae]